MKPFIAFFILILLSTVEADLDEIKEKAQEYGAYDEVVANITEISYRGNIYYWVDFERVFQYSGSLLLDEDRNPVRDENVILAFARARVIHRGYGRKVISEWFALASSYGETSGAIYELRNSFEDKLVRSKIEVLANDFKALGELSSESALYLNRSLSIFSPFSFMGCRFYNYICSLFFNEETYIDLFHILTALSGVNPRNFTRISNISLTSKSLCRNAEESLYGSIAIPLLSFPFFTLLCMSSAFFSEPRDTERINFIPSESIPLSRRYLINFSMATIVCGCFFVPNFFTEYINMSIKKRRNLLRKTDRKPQMLKRRIEFKSPRG